MFKTWSLLSCITVFLLFLFGGIVRATGSGMGCPDWPKCFGLYIPPTCECQLPSNYKQDFLEQRLKKLNKMGSVLQNMGLTSYANRILNDKSIREPEPFNALKTWIEYINRLVGALAGVFTLFMFIASVRFLKTNKKVFYWSLASLILLLINAYMGSIVVATNLLPGIVSIHYLAAFACLFAICKTMNVYKGFTFLSSYLILPKWHFSVLIVLSFIIVIFGTYSREVIDFMIHNNTLYKNNAWDMQNIGITFALHRYLPLVLLTFVLFMFYNLKTARLKHSLLLVVISLITLQISLGVINIWFQLPVWSRIGHVFIGGAIPLCVIFLVLFRFQRVNGN